MIKSYLNVNSLVVALLLAISPLLLIQLQQIWQLWYYTFFPLALAGFVLLIYKEWQSSSSPSQARVVWGNALSSIAVCLAIAAALVFSPWLAQAAALAIVASWMVQRLDQTRWTRILSWFLILFTFMPIPLDLHDLLVWNIQWSAVESASHLLDLLGVVNLFDGSQFAVGSFSVELDSFNSRFDNVWVVTAITVLIACYNRLGLIQSTLLISAAPAWSWAASTIRILLATVSQEFLSIEMERGWTKESVSILVLLATTYLIFVTSKFLGTLFNRVPSRAEEADTTKPLRDVYNRLTGHFKDEPVTTTVTENHTVSFRIFGAMIATCLMIAIIAFYGRFQSPIMGSPNRFLTLPSIERVRETLLEKSLPSELPGAKLVDFELKHRQYPGILRPEYDAVWRYDSAEGNVAISLRFPIRGVTLPDSASWDPIVLYSKSDLMSISERAEGFSVPIGLVEEIRMKHLILGDLNSLSTRVDLIDTDRWESSSIDSGGRLSRLTKFLYVQPLGFQLSILKDAGGRELKDEERQRIVGLLVNCMGHLKPAMSSLIDR